MNRLKCDIISDARLKVDMRILNDKTKQRYNVESDISVMKASDEYPGDAKFISDRCKLSIENKTTIDRFLLDSVKIKSVESLQISGLEVFFINTCLEEPGLYVTTELNHYKVDKAVKNFGKYMNLAIDFLCFRDECVSISNNYDEHLITAKNKKKSNKRPIDNIMDGELTMKQESIRGT
ncbi:hypothetical protein MFLAVUS_009765 [Mucor flavus]|uniref:Uncharacterized protein n=1 Tax=Mucor flavus TaxID=439312 RepID=A0ABP9ZB09_9FUNG